MTSNIVFSYLVLGRDVLRDGDPRRCGRCGRDKKVLVHHPLSEYIAPLIVRSGRVNAHTRNCAPSTHCIGEESLGKMTETSTFVSHCRCASALWTQRTRGRHVCVVHIFLHLADTDATSPGYLVHLLLVPVQGPPPAALASIVAESVELPTFLPPILT